jgi:hypothetical protein
MNTLVESFAAAFLGAKMAKNDGAKALSAVEKKARPIPSSLAELWQWSDGAKEPCFFDPESATLKEDEGLRFLSLKEAASEMKERPGPKEGVVFGSDLGGGLLVAIGEKGRVASWDHETDELEVIAPTFDAFLKRSTRALKARGKKATKAPPASPMSVALKAMFGRALSSACRDKAIVLLNHPKARGGPERDEAWVFDSLASMLVANGDAAFVEEHARNAGHERKA